MRIGIMGAGAIGSIVGGLLTKAGHDVTLIDQWPAHVETMRTTGLRLSGGCGDHLIPVTALHLYEAQRIQEPFEAVFLAVKAYDTEWATMFASRFLREPDGVIVDFQNGINDERVAREVFVQPLSRRLAIRIAAEVIQVGRAAGHAIEPIYGLEAQRFVDAAAGQGQAGLEVELLALGQGRTGGRRSFLQDVLRGRRTEINELNGLVVAEGQRLGVPTPVNQAVVQEVLRHGVGTLRPSPRNLEPLVSLVS